MEAGPVRDFQFKKKKTIKRLINKEKKMQVTVPATFPRKYEIAQTPKV
jgi:hypothetical protein